MFTNIDLSLNKILGEGGYGTVYEGVWRKKPVAIKRIHLSDKVSNKLEEEVLKRLDHPNVIKLLYVGSDSDFRYYLLELCTASLDKLFLKDEDSKKYLGPMPPTFDVLNQLALGLEYIHKMKIIHRDIKPQNVLIWVNSKNGEVMMKWADFALSQPVNERGTFTMSGVRGTFEWLAPELLKLLDDVVKEGESEIRGTVKTDVFAEGLVFGYYLIGGIHLFGSRFQIAANILMNNPVNLYKIQLQYARDLIRKMLADRPEKRITSSDVVYQLERIIRIDQSSGVAQHLVKHVAVYQTGVKTTKLNNPPVQYARTTIHRSSNFLTKNRLFVTSDLDLLQPTTAPSIKKIKLDKKKILGRGGYSQVFEGEWKNNQVAVKRIHLSKVVGHKQEEEITLKRLHHSNVIKLLHVESDADFKYFVLELCQASLDRLFLKDGNPKKYLGPMPSTIDVLVQLSMGLKYIHEERLVHRDIKPQNVLIWVNSDNDHVLLKWADFGLSKLVNERGSYSMSRVRGTTGWLAPEILKLIESGDTQEENETQIRGTVKTDVFAEGLVFGYFLLRGGHLFGSRLSIQSNIVNNKTVNLPNVTQKYARDLIEKMLIPNPKNRISSSDVTRELLHAKELHI